MPSSPCVAINCTFFQKLLDLFIIYRKQSQLVPCTVGEPPKSVNDNRFLVFLDQGGALYCTASDLRRCSTQLETMSPWMRSYLESYPERAMVRLAEGQKVELEIDGEMLSTIVEKVDCSMVLLSKGMWQEWVYRGDPRLGPLRQQGNRSGRVGRVQGPRRPLVEYRNFPTSAQVLLASNQDRVP